MSPIKKGEETYHMTDKKMTRTVVVERLVEVYTSREKSSIFHLKTPSLATDINRY